MQAVDLYNPVPAPTSYPEKKNNGKHGNELHTCFIFHLSNQQRCNSVMDGQLPFKEGAGSAQCQSIQVQPQDNDNDQVVSHIVCICWNLSSCVL